MSIRQPLLKGVRILDISEGVAGPFASKLLADLGADTVKIERPGVGDVSRSFGPFPGGVQDLEKSASFLFLNTNKKSVVLDLQSEPGIYKLKQLMSSYDVVISNQTANSLDEQGIGFECMRSQNPKIILTTVTGFGCEGPYSEFGWSHLISCAMGGWANNCGLPEREPLQAGGALSETLTGSYAAAATLLAVFGRLKHGRGEHVDVSAQEAVLCGASLPSLLFEYSGAITGRYSSVGSGAGAGYMLPTRKGYVGLNALTLPQWHMLCKFLGREQVASDSYYEGISWAKPDERLEEIREIFLEALENKTAEELFHEAQKWRVPFGLVPSISELFEMTPHVERGFFLDLEHPQGSSYKVPGVPFKSDNAEITISRAPMLGEHTDKVLAEIDDAQPNRSRNELKIEKLNPLPMKGILVVDLSMFFAGPVAAQILADAGAEVIKVESIQRIDGWRGSGTLSEQGLSSWEASPYFNWVNRNKKDVTLDLTAPEGVEILKKLVKEADVLIENYTPRVMQNFGLSYDVLKSINPGLVMISLSGYGQKGSWRDYVAFGMSTEQMSGVAHLTGYENEDPLYTGTTGGDLFSGVMGVLDLLAALWQREQTGFGQYLDFSQIEACNMYVGDVMTGWSLAGFDPERISNDHASYRLQGMFPCLNDGWIGITCKDQEQVMALADYFKEPSIMQPELTRIEMLRCIGRYTELRDKVELMRDLQSLGVPAGAVLNGPELLNNEQLKERGAFLAQDRPQLGIKHYPNQPYRFRLTETPPSVRAPLLGEHLEEVLTTKAGLTSDEIAELVIDDIIGTEPVSARL